ncbi:radical SAM protein [Candidatus Bathyarchaeota archaeon]|nr:radical SAM protein [Candidatus Bathyarchaeota archaeon]
MVEGLREVTLEVTRGCPLRCISCQSNAGLPHKNELPFSDWLRIVDEAAEMKATSFVLSGGEPFTSPYFHELCNYIYGKERNLSIRSSGNVYDTNRITHIDEETLGFLSEMEGVRLVFNLDGATEETHEETTLIKDSYANTVKSIKNAVKAGIYTEISFTPTKINYHELPELIRLAERLYVDAVNVSRFVAQGRGRITKHILELRDSDLVKLNDSLSAIVDNDLVRFDPSFNSFTLSGRHSCTAGVDRMTVRYDGYAVPCEAMKFMAEEQEDIDVRVHTLREIYTDSILFNLARKLRSMTLGTECSGCEHVEKCGGGCPAQKVLNTSIDARDPYCRVRLEDRVREILV